MHEDLDLTCGAARSSGRGRRIGHRQVGADALDHRLQQPDAGSIEVLGESMIGAGRRRDRHPQPLGRAVSGRRAVFHADRGRKRRGAAARILSRDRPELRDEIAAYKVMLSGLPARGGGQIPSELSGGMKKRAGLARALALDPELLFLDEPTAGLDPIGAAAFDELTRELQETLGLTVFLITHDLDTLYEICDRVAVLADKR
jgi:phospholipid/cholesterol/gamma-HCH transport system ATP-binding protein